MPQLSNKQKTGIAGICVAAAGACLSLTQGSEGYVAKAKPDPAHILTGCYGERVDQSDLDPNHVYSKSECGVRLRNRLASEYAPKIVYCAPEVADNKRVKVFAALLDASYNAGPGAVCRSPMVAAIRRGNWVRGCNAFRGWFVTARDRRTGRRFQLPGLVRRRNAEAALCRQGL